jgi:sodium-dependent phosphate transporter
LIQEKETGLRWYHIPIIRCVGPRHGKSASSEENGKANQTGELIITEGDSKTKRENGEDVIEKEPEDLNLPTRVWRKFVRLAMHGLNKSVPDYKHDENEEMHSKAVKYDDDVEYLYSFLQVVTATFASFAHGSNDVANAIGPLSVVYGIWDTGKADVSGKTPVPLWILAYGGLAIDAGLLLYGYHVMRSLGNRITYHSPSRGFSMELGASLTVVTASKIGLPISTTHCITGATIGVGLCNGSLGALNWPLIAWCFFSWILTLPVAGTIAGVVFAFAANAPKLL